MKTIELFEYRRNEHLNPKISVNKHLIDILDHTTDEIGDVKNNFISFTKVDKLGINPSSNFNTPIGIYAYPTQYVVQQRGEHEKMSNMEFAGHHPFVNTFKVQGNIINVSNMTKSETNYYYKKINNLLKLLMEGKELFRYFEPNIKTSEDIIKKYINQSNKEANVKKIGGRFWYVTWKLAYETLPKLMNKKGHLIWNWLFRQIEIDGVVDQGDGIIHRNEKTQAVFFSKEVIYDVKRFNNKTYPKPQSRENETKLSDLAKKQINYMTQISSTPEEIIDDLKHNPYRPFMFMAIRKILLPAVHKNHELFFQIPRSKLNDVLIKMGLDSGIPLNKIKLYQKGLKKENIHSEINNIHEEIDYCQTNINLYTKKIDNAKKIKDTSLDEYYNTKIMFYKNEIKKLKKEIKELESLLK